MRQRYLSPSALGLLLLLFACSSSDEGNGELPVFRFDDDTDPVEMGLSELVESFDIVPLETNDSILIANPRIFAADDFILVGSMDFRNPVPVYFFDRAGSFLAEAGGTGRGPGEHIGSMIQEISYTADKNALIIHFGIATQEHQVFDLRGNYLRSLKNQSYYSTANLYQLSDSVFFIPGQMAGRSLNRTDSARLTFFGSTGEITSTISRADFPPASEERSYQAHRIPSNSKTYRYQDEWKMYFEGGDTIFRIVDRMLVASTVLTASARLDLNDNDTGDNLKGKIRLGLALETSNSLFVRKFVITGVRSQDMMGMTMTTLDTEPFMVIVDKQSSEMRSVTLVDDIFSILPEKDLNNQRLIWQDDGILHIFYQAPDLISRMDSIKRVGKLSSEVLEKLETLKENDNPVVFVFKLKSTL